MSRFDLLAILLAALAAASLAQVPTYGPCICKCAIAQSTAPGLVARCIDNPNPSTTQDCSSQCNNQDIAAFCQRYLTGSTVYGLAAYAFGTDVTCAGGGSSAFPYSLTVWPILTAPATPCITPPPSVTSVTVTPAALGSNPFTLGACFKLTIGNDVRGIQLLGVSVSKNFIAFVYNDAACSPSSFLLSFGGQARSDCPNSQVAPSSTATQVASAAVFFAAKVPGSASSSNIACMCKCANPNSVVGPILGCSDVPASQCGGAYCSSTYPGQCTSPNYYLATPPPDPVASQGIPCAGISGYQLSAKTYRAGTFCPYPSSNNQIGTTTYWSANDCVSSFNTGYSQRFLGCSNKDYYIFQTFLGSGCQKQNFISLTGGQAGCTFNTYPFGYTTTYSCTSPAQALAAGIIVAIVIGAIVVIVAASCMCRYFRRRQQALLVYSAY